MLVLAETLPVYAWVLIAIFAFLMILGLIIFLIISRQKREGRPHTDSSSLLSALGGEENILSHELRGSRIILSCKDYSLVDHEKLKKAGVSGFVQSSNKLTLVLKEGADQLYDSLFPKEGE